MDHLRLIGWAVAAALALAAIACAGGNSSGGGIASSASSTATASQVNERATASATSATVATSTVSPSPRAVDRVLTARNIELTRDLNGLTVQVPAGDIFLINLGEGYDWSVDWSPPGVARSWEAAAQPRGSQGYYSLDVPGSSAVLSGSGTPVCATPAAAARCTATTAVPFSVIVVAGPAR